MDYQEAWIELRDRIERQLGALCASENPSAPLKAAGLKIALQYMIDQEALVEAERKRTHYRCGWEGVTGRCDQIAREKRKTCPSHKRYENDSRVSQGPQLGQYSRREQRP